MRNLYTVNMGMSFANRRRKYLKLIQEMEDLDLFKERALVEKRLKDLEGREKGLKAYPRVNPTDADFNEKMYGVTKYYCINFGCGRELSRPEYLSGNLCIGCRPGGKIIRDL